ncbi:MAG: hypothetical protein ACRC80_31975 [Waterburya sp.]
MIDKPITTVKAYVDGAFETDPNLVDETAEALTVQGLRTVRLIPESVILSAITKYKPDLLMACAAAGLRVFLHRLAGFEVLSTAIAPTKTDVELRLEAELRAKDLECQLLNANLKVAEVEKLMVEKENYILQAVKGRAGLESMLEYFQEVNDGQNLLAGTESNVTAWEWMVANKKIILEDTMFRKFVSKIHGAYKAIHHSAPIYEYRQQTNNPKKNKKVQVYNHRHFGILEQCYIQTLLEA